MVDTFIVRVYRRGAVRGRELTGTIEHVESGERVGFDGSGELLARLLGTPAAGDQHRSQDQAVGGEGPENSG